MTFAKTEGKLGREKGNARTCAVPNDPALDAAVAALESNLRQPSEQLPFRWCHSSLSGRDIIDINSVYPLLLAWVRIDPSTAESILKGVFYLQDSDGAIYSRYLPDGTALTDEAPWPLLIQAVRLVWNASGNVDFLKTIMPRVYRYADWICYHFDPKQSGIPCWRSNEEALIADLYQDGTASPDLSLLLLRELDTLSMLENDQPRIFRDNLYLKPETDKLIKLVQNKFWDRSRNAFRILPLEGAPDSAAPDFFTALATICERISPEIRIQAKPVLARVLKLFDKPEIWIGGRQLQVNSIYAFLLIDAARSAGMHAECIQFLEKIKHFISKQDRQGVAMPDELSEQEAEGDGFPGPGPGTRPSAAMAALAVHVEGLLRDYGTAPSRPASILQKMNRHPAFFGILPFLLLAAFIAVVSVATISRTDPTGPGLEAGIGLAKQYYKAGNYHEALKISEALMSSHMKTEYPEMMRAKSLYKLGNYREAEQIFEKMLERDSSSSFLKLNLALLKYKQNRFDEAVDIYNDFIENYGEEMPYEKARAEAALKLLEETQSFRGEEGGN